MHQQPATATTTATTNQPRLQNSFSPEMAANFAMTHFSAFTLACQMKRAKDPTQTNTMPHTHRAQTEETRSQMGRKSAFQGKQFN